MTTRDRSWTVEGQPIFGCPCRGGEGDCMILKRCEGPGSAGRGGGGGCREGRGGREEIGLPGGEGPGLEGRGSGGGREGTGRRLGCREGRGRDGRGLCNVHTYNILTL